MTRFLLRFFVSLMVVVLAIQFGAWTEDVTPIRLTESALVRHMANTASDSKIHAHIRELPGRSSDAFPGITVSDSSWDNFFFVERVFADEFGPKNPFADRGRTVYVLDLIANGEYVGHIFMYGVRSSFGPEVSRYYIKAYLFGPNSKLLISATKDYFSEEEVIDWFEHSLDSLLLFYEEIH